MPNATTMFSGYDNDHAFNGGNALNGFFVGLLHTKLELVVERRFALGLSCTLSEMFQSSTLDLGKK